MTNSQPTAIPQSAEKSAAMCATSSKQTGKATQKVQKKLGASPVWPFSRMMLSSATLVAPQSASSLGVSAVTSSQSTGAQAVATTSAAATRTTCTSRRTSRSASFAPRSFKSSGVISASPVRVGKSPAATAIPSICSPAISARNAGRCSFES